MATQVSRHPTVSSELETATRSVITKYLNELKERGLPTKNIYRVIVDAVERPMLDELLKWSGGNQTHAAEAMGINRATLRTKILRHGVQLEKQNA